MFSVDDTPTVATGVASSDSLDSASGNHPVVLWEFTNSQWVQSLSVDVDAPLDATPGFVVTDLTGDGKPDLMYSYSSPRFMLNGVLSSEGGRWRRVLFDGKPEAYQLDASSGTLTSTYIGEFPDGAGASVTSYQYDHASGGFIGTDVTPSTSQASIDTKDPQQVAQAFVDAWARSDTTSLSQYGESMAVNTAARMTPPDPTTLAACETMQSGSQQCDVDAPIAPYDYYLLLDQTGAGWLVTYVGPVSRWDGGVDGD